MSSFDPEAFLAEPEEEEEVKGFDPEAFLAEPAPAPEPVPDPVSAPAPAGFDPEAFLNEPVASPQAAPGALPEIKLDQPKSEQDLRTEIFGMLNEKGRLSPTVQRNVADPESGFFGTPIKAGKNLIGDTFEAVGHAIGLFAEKFGATPASLQQASMNDLVEDETDLIKARNAMSGGSPEQVMLDEFIGAFQKNGITDGRAMMTKMKDAIKENVWDTTSNDDTRVLSDGSIRVNPKLVALQSPDEGVAALRKAGADDKAIQEFGLARKAVAQAMHEKTASYESSYRQHVKEMKDKGVTDPEEVFYSWDGLDRNFIEKSYDVVRDSVAEAGRGMYRTTAGMAIGVDSLGEHLPGAVGDWFAADKVSAARKILESSNKSEYVSSIATSRGEQGPIVGSVKEMTTSLGEMAPMFASGNVGRSIGGAAEASAAQKLLGKSIASTGVYGWAAAQGYGSVIQTAIESANRKAQAERRPVTDAELVKAIDDHQFGALGNAFQTATLARLLPQGAEAYALKGLSASSKTITGREVYAALVKQYGEKGVRGAIMSMKPELKAFAKDVYGAAKVGFKDEALEEGTNQFLEGLITKMGGADADKTWDQIGQETFKGSWQGGIIGSGVQAGGQMMAKPATIQESTRQQQMVTPRALEIAASRQLHMLRQKEEGTPGDATTARVLGTPLTKAEQAYKEKLESLIPEGGQADHSGLANLYGVGIKRPTVVGDLPPGTVVDTDGNPISRDPVVQDFVDEADDQADAAGLDLTSDALRNQSLPPPRGFEDVPLPNPFTGVPKPRGGPGELDLGGAKIPVKSMDGPGLMQEVFGDPGKGRQYRPDLDISKFTLQPHQKGDTRHVLYEGKMPTQAVYDTATGKFSKVTDKGNEDIADAYNGGWSMLSAQRYTGKGTKAELDVLADTAPEPGQDIPEDDPTIAADQTRKVIKSSLAAGATPEQRSVLERLNEVYEGNEILHNPESSGKERYQINGKQANSTTTVVGDEVPFTGTQTAEDIAYGKEAAKSGDEIHKVLENWVAGNPQENLSPRDARFLKDLEEELGPMRKEGYVFLPETIVFDEASEMAGKMDIIAIAPDGTVHNIDLKTMEPGRTNARGEATGSPHDAASRYNRYDRGVKHEAQSAINIEMLNRMGIKADPANSRIIFVDRTTGEIIGDESTGARVGHKKLVQSPRAAAIRDKALKPKTAPPAAKPAKPAAAPATKPAATPAPVVPKAPVTKPIERLTKPSRDADGYQSEADLKIIADELDSLPVGSQVADILDNVWTKEKDGTWATTKVEKGNIGKSSTGNLSREVYGQKGSDLAGTLGGRKVTLPTSATPEAKPVAKPAAPVASPQAKPATKEAGGSAEIGRTDFDPQTGLVSIETTSKLSGRKFMIEAESRQNLKDPTKGRTNWVLVPEDTKRPGEYAGILTKGKDGAVLSAEEMRNQAVIALGEDVVVRIENAQRTNREKGMAGADESVNMINGVLAELAGKPATAKPAAAPAAKPEEAARTPEVIQAELDALKALINKNLRSQPPNSEPFRQNKAKEKALMDELSKMSPQAPTRLASPSSPSTSGTNGWTESNATLEPKIGRTRGGKGDQETLSYIDTDPSMPNPLKVGDVVVGTDDQGRPVAVHVVTMTYPDGPGTRHIIQKVPLTMAKDTQALADTDLNVKALMDKAKKYVPNKIQVATSVEMMGRARGNPTFANASKEDQQAFLSMIKSSFDAIGGRAFSAMHVQFTEEGDDMETHLDGKTGKPTHITINVNNLWKLLSEAADSIPRKSTQAHIHVGEAFVNLVTQMAFHEAAHYVMAQHISPEVAIDTGTQMLVAGSAATMATLRSRFQAQASYGDGKLHELSDEQMLELMSGKAVVFEGKTYQMSKQQIDTEKYALTHEWTVKALEIMNTGNSIADQRAALDLAASGYARNAKGEPIDPGAARALVNRLIDLANQALEAVRRFLNVHYTLGNIPPEQAALVFRLNELMRQEGLVAPDITGVYQRSFEMAENATKGVERLARNDWDAKEAKEQLVGEISKIQTKKGDPDFKPVMYDGDGRLVMNPSLSMDERNQLALILNELNSPQRIEATRESMKWARATRLVLEGLNGGRPLSARDLTRLDDGRLEVVNNTNLGAMFELDKSSNDNDRLRRAQEIQHLSGPLIRNMERMVGSAAGMSVEEIAQQLNERLYADERRDQDAAREANQDYVRTSPRPIPEFTQASTGRTSISTSSFMSRAADPALQSYLRDIIGDRYPQFAAAVRKANATTEALEGMHTFKEKLNHMMTGGPTPKSMWQEMQEGWQNVNAIIADKSHLLNPTILSSAFLDSTPATLVRGRAAVRAKAKEAKPTSVEILDETVELPGDTVSSSEYGAWVDGLGTRMERAKDAAWALLGIRQQGKTKDEKTGVTYKGQEKLGRMISNLLNLGRAMTGNVIESYKNGDLNVTHTVMRFGGFPMPVRVDENGEHILVPAKAISLPSTRPATGPAGEVVWPSSDDLMNDGSMGQMIGAIFREVQALSNPMEGRAAPVLQLSEGLTPAGLGHSILAPNLANFLAITKQLMIPVRQEDGTMVKHSVGHLIAEGARRLDDLIRAEDPNSDPQNHANVLEAYKSLAPELHLSEAYKVERDNLAKNPDSLKFAFYQLNNLGKSYNALYRHSIRQLKIQDPARAISEMERSLDPDQRDMLDFKVLSNISWMVNYVRKSYEWINIRNADRARKAGIIEEGQVFGERLSSLRFTSPQQGLDEYHWIQAQAPIKTIEVSRDQEGFINRSTPDINISDQGSTAEDTSTRLSVNDAFDTSMDDLIEGELQKERDHISRMQRWRTEQLMAMHGGNAAMALQYATHPDFRGNPDKLDHWILDRLEKHRDEEVARGTIADRWGNTFDHHLEDLIANNPESADMLRALQYSGGTIGEAGSAEILTRNDGETYESSPTSLAQALSTLIPNLRIIQGKVDWSMMNSPSQPRQDLAPIKADGSNVNEPTKSEGPPNKPVDFLTAADGSPVLVFYTRNHGEFEPQIMRDVMAKMITWMGTRGGVDTVNTLRNTIGHISHMNDYDLPVSMKATIRQIMFTDEDGFVRPLHAEEELKLTAYSRLWSKALQNSVEKELLNFADPLAYFFNPKTSAQALENVTPEEAAKVLALALTHNSAKKIQGFSMVFHDYGNEEASEERKAMYGAFLGSFGVPSMEGAMASVPTDVFTDLPMHIAVENDLGQNVSKPGQQNAFGNIQKIIEDALPAGAEEQKDDSGAKLLVPIANKGFERANNILHETMRRLSPVFSGPAQASLAPPSIEEQLMDAPWNSVPKVENPIKPAPPGLPLREAPKSTKLSMWEARQMLATEDPVLLRDAVNKAMAERESSLPEKRAALEAQVQGQTYEDAKRPDGSDNSEATKELALQEARAYEPHGRLSVDELTQLTDEQAAKLRSMRLVNNDGSPEARRMLGHLGALTLTNSRDNNYDLFNRERDKYGAITAAMSLGATIIPPVPGDSVTEVMLMADMKALQKEAQDQNFVRYMRDENGEWRDIFDVINDQRDREIEQSQAIIDGFNQSAVDSIANARKAAEAVTRLKAIEAQLIGSKSREEFLQALRDANFIRLEEFDENGERIDSTSSGKWIERFFHERSQVAIGLARAALSEHASSRDSFRTAQLFNNVSAAAVTGIAKGPLAEEMMEVWGKYKDQSRDWKNDLHDVVTMLHQAQDLLDVDVDVHPDDYIGPESLVRSARTNYAEVENLVDSYNTGVLEVVRRVNTALGGAEFTADAEEALRATRAGLRVPAMTRGPLKAEDFTLPSPGTEYFNRQFGNGNLIKRMTAFNNMVSSLNSNAFLNELNARSGVEEALAALNRGTRDELDSRDISGLSSDTRVGIPREALGPMRDILNSDESDGAKLDKLSALFTEHLTPMDEQMEDAYTMMKTTMNDAMLEAQEKVIKGQDMISEITKLGQQLAAGSGLDTVTTNRMVIQAIQESLEHRASFDYDAAEQAMRKRISQERTNVQALASVGATRSDGFHLLNIVGSPEQSLRVKRVLMAYGRIHNIAYQKIMKGSQGITSYENAQEAREQADNDLVSGRTVTLRDGLTYDVIGNILEPADSYQKVEAELRRRNLDMSPKQMTVNLSRLSFPAYVGAFRKASTTSEQEALKRSAIEDHIEMLRTQIAEDVAAGRNVSKLQSRLLDDQIALSTLDENQGRESQTPVNLRFLGGEERQPVNQVSGLLDRIGWEEAGEFNQEHRAQNIKDLKADIKRLKDEIGKLKEAGVRIAPGADRTESGTAAERADLPPLASDSVVAKEMQAEVDEEARRGDLMREARTKGRPVDTLSRKVPRSPQAPVQPVEPAEYQAPAPLAGRVMPSRPGEPMTREELNIRMDALKDKLEQRESQLEWVQSPEFEEKSNALPGGNNLILGTPMKTPAQKATLDRAVDSLVAATSGSMFAGPNDSGKAVRDYQLRQFRTLMGMVHEISAAGVPADWGSRLLPDGTMTPPVLPAALAAIDNLRINPGGHSEMQAFYDAAFKVSAQLQVDNNGARLASGYMPKYSPIRGGNGLFAKAWRAFAGLDPRLVSSFAKSGAAIESARAIFDENLHAASFASLRLKKVLLKQLGDVYDRHISRKDPSKGILTRAGRRIANRAKNLTTVDPRWGHASMGMLFEGIRSALITGSGNPEQRAQRLKDKWESWNDTRVASRYHARIPSGVLVKDILALPMEGAVRTYDWLTNSHYQMLREDAAFNESRAFFEPFLDAIIAGADEVDVITAMRDALPEESRNYGKGMRKIFEDYRQVEIEAAIIAGRDPAYLDNKPIVPLHETSGENGSSVTMSGPSAAGASLSALIDSITMAPGVSIFREIVGKPGVDAYGMNPAQLPIPGRLEEQTGPHATQMKDIARALSILGEDMLDKRNNRSMPRSRLASFIHFGAFYLAQKALLSIVQPILQTLPQAITHRTIHWNLARGFNRLLFHNMISKTADLVSQKIPGMKFASSRGSLSRATRGFAEQWSPPTHSRRLGGEELHTESIKDSGPSRVRPGNKLPMKLAKAAAGLPGAAIRAQLGAGEAALSLVMSGPESILGDSIFLNFAFNEVNRQRAEIGLGNVRLDQFLANPESHGMSHSIAMDAHRAVEMNLPPSETHTKGSMAQSAGTISDELVRGLFMTFASHIISMAANQVAAYRVAMNAKSDEWSKKPFTGTGARPRDWSTRRKHTRNFAALTAQKAMFVGFRYSVLTKAYTSLMAWLLGWDKEKEEKVLKSFYGMQDGNTLEERQKHASYWVAHMLDADRPWGFKEDPGGVPGQGGFVDSKNAQDKAVLGMNLMKEMFTSTPFGGVGMMASTTMGELGNDFIQERMLSLFTKAHIPEYEQAGVADIHPFDDVRGLGPNSDSGIERAVYQFTEGYQNNFADRSAFLGAGGIALDALTAITNAEPGKLDGGSLLDLGLSLSPAMPRAETKRLKRQATDKMDAKIWKSFYREK